MKTLIRNTFITIMRSLLCLALTVIIFTIIIFIGTFFGGLANREAFYLDLGIPLVAAIVAPLVSTHFFKKPYNYHIVGIGFILLSLALQLYYVIHVSPILRRAGDSEFDTTWGILSASSILIGAIISYGKMLWSYGFFKFLNRSKKSEFYNGNLNSKKGTLDSADTLRSSDKLKSPETPQSTQPNIYHKWWIDQSSLDASGTWRITIAAVRSNGEELIALSWVAIDSHEIPIVTASFHRENATIWLRILYSAFTALDDPHDYISQIGLSWTKEINKTPSSALIGSVEEYGGLQAYVDWSINPRWTQLFIYPPKGGRISVLFGIEAIAQMTLLTKEAFKMLSWPIPE